MTDRFHHLDVWRTTPHDAVIVGGGPAGLSAALVLGRARKQVLVVDNDRPANAVSRGVGGLLGHDRVTPADLRDSGQRQLQEHANVELRHGAVEDAQPTRHVFVVRPTDGPPVRAHAIVLAHGLRYDPPPAREAEAPPEVP
jgi:thioredoxin reductase